jgi:N-sulfoglucosamine sulfohydrolase
MKMHLSSLLVFLFLSLSFKSYTQNAKPNILWLSVEDMSPRLSCYGDSTILSPNINQLFKQGMLYANMYTTAGVCAPSRHAIATGMIQTSTGGHNMRTLQNTYPEKTGLPLSYSVVLPGGVRHFSEYLREEGYYCTNNEKTDYQFENTSAIWDESGPQAHYKNRSPEQPFFSVFNYVGTHESQIWAKKSRPLRVDPKKVKVPPFLPDTDSVRLDIARHYTNISEMDDWVGDKIEELKKDRLLENTIIMFWSDHGDGLPNIKREINKRGLHVPFIVRFPKAYSTIGEMPPGYVETKLCSSLDWAPTVLSLAGIKAPVYMQGKALLGKYMHKEGHQYIFAARDRLDSEYDRSRSVFDGRYQYIYNFDTSKPKYADVGFRKSQAGMREILRLKEAGKLNKEQYAWFLQPKAKEEFFDLEKDPFQSQNEIENPLYRSDIERFRIAFLNWQKNITDFGAMNEKALIKSMWQGENTQPITANVTYNKKKGRIYLKSMTSSATIVYKILDPNKEESRSWNIYKEGILLKKNQKLKVKAQRIGFKESEISIY